jgi:hypothetical protein
MSLTRKLNAQLGSLPIDARTEISQFVAACTRIIIVPTSLAYVTITIDNIIRNHNLQPMPALSSRIYAELLSQSPENLSDFARVHAARIPAHAINFIAKLLKEIPRLENVVEYVPHADHAFVEKINREHHLHIDKVTTHCCKMPVIEDARDGDVIIINGLRYGALIFSIFAIIDILLERDPKLYFIILHDNSIECKCHSIIGHTQYGSATLVALCGNEKRVVQTHLLFD